MRFVFQVSTIIVALCMNFGFAPAKGAAQDLAKARMGAMLARVNSLTATNSKGKTIPLIEKPLFRYSDPIRATHDGIISAWSEGGRPTALIGLFTEPATEDLISWSYEFISLSESKFKISSPAAYKEFQWTPQKSELDWKTVPDTKVKSTVKVRIRNQMKAVAERFAVTEEMRGVHRLRRLPKAIHEYQDDELGVKLGGVYLFAYGTNPEALLLLECHVPTNGSDPPHWKFAFARATAAEIWAELDGTNVWRPEIAWRTNSLADANSSYVIRGMESKPITE